MNYLPSKGEWFRITNQASDIAQVYIFDDISYFGITANDFVNELSRVTAPKMNVHINCKGGDVFDGIAIYNALRAHPSEVTTRVTSLAASIASVIVQGGDHRVMEAHSQMMIHDAMAVAVGNAEEFRDFADLLDKQSDLIASIYAERKGDKRSAPKIRSLMKAETWLSDQEAVDLGLADIVETPKKAEAPVPAAEAPTAAADSIDWVSVFSETHKEYELV